VTRFIFGESAETECDWHGVTCEEGLVTSLCLCDGGATGSIPTELGNLKKLRILELSQNQLTGSIPPEIGNMTSLWNLRLDIGYFLFTNHYRHSDSTSIKNIQWT